MWSGIFAVWSGNFAAEKRAWQQYIRRNSGLTKKVILVQNISIGQKAEITLTLEEAGRYQFFFWRVFLVKKKHLSLLTSSKWVSTMFQPCFVLDTPPRRHGPSGTAMSPL